MLQEQLDNDEKITVVIPGGFKPPHKGHVEMINHFANLPNVEEVIVFMGSKPRMSADKSVVVSKDKSIELFKLFDLAPNIRFGDVTQRPKKDGSTYENPFSDAVDVLFDERFAGKKVAIGHPTKDPAYGDAFAARAKSMKKDMAADLVAVTPADTTGGLSATDLRNAVQDGDIERLKNFIPSNIVEDYLKILIGD
jgi:cytidyltransferase-like protein